MLKQPRTVNVLGTDICVSFREEKDDPKLDVVNGYFDCTEHLIVVKVPEQETMSLGDMEAMQRQTLRHELIHAFLYESGLDHNSGDGDPWAVNEEMVDWFAIQSPKIFKVFQEQGLL